MNERDRYRVVMEVELVDTDHDVEAVKQRYFGFRSALAKLAQTDKYSGYVFEVPQTFAESDFRESPLFLKVRMHLQGESWSAISRMGQEMIRSAAMEVGMGVVGDIPEQLLVNQEGASYGVDALQLVGA